MNLLRLAAEAINVESAEHIAYDIGAGAVLALVMASKGLEMLRSFGILPEKNGNGNGMVKSVGRLHVDSLKALVRNEINSALFVLIAKQDKQIELLTRIVTILEERK